MKDAIKDQNRKSLHNLLPEDALINRGVIFYQLPHLLMIYSGLSESKSHHLLQQARLLTDNPGLTSDEAFYRKVRENNITRDDAHRYASKISPSPQSLDAAMSHLDATTNGLDGVGGWFFLASYVHGIKRSGISSDLHHYLDFVLSLCELDKKRLEGVDTGLDDELRTFLPYKGLSESIEQQAKFLVSLVLHWAALFEHFLIIEQGSSNDVDNSTPLIFNHCTPVITKQNKIQRSNEIFFDWIKSWWTQHEHSKEKISWNQFYRDVANARGSDTDPDSIKKNIQRMRKGEQPLTIESFENNVAVLYTSKEDFDKLDSTRMTIPFIQLFDNIQKEFINKGVAQEYIVSLFERYPDYFNLVSRRYNDFRV